MSPNTKEKSDIFLGRMVSINNSESSGIMTKPTQLQSFLLLQMTIDKNGSISFH